MKEVVSEVAYEFGDFRAVHSILDLGDFVRNVGAQLPELLQRGPDTECQSAIRDDVLLRDVTDGKIDFVLEIRRVRQRA